jgi:hypothetical protein
MVTMTICLLVRDAVFCSRPSPTFRTNALLPSLGSKSKQSKQQVTINQEAECLWKFYAEIVGRFMI